MRYTIAELDAMPLGAFIAAHPTELDASDSQHDPRWFMWRKEDRGWLDYARTESWGGSWANPEYLATLDFYYTFPQPIGGKE